MRAPYYKRKRDVEYYHNITKEKEGYYQYRKEKRDSWYQKNKDKVSEDYYLSKFEKQQLKNPEWIINLINKIFEDQ
jgi:hypothetical protein